jgi:hypothetical protein
MASVYVYGWQERLMPLREYVGGPITGIIEFGNGSATSRIEFDIPAPSCTPSFTTTPSDQLIPPMGGVSIPICASSIRVYARNDATMSLISTVAPGVIGYYSNADGPDSPTYTKDPQIGAFVGYGQTMGGNSHLYKTIYLGYLGGWPSGSLSNIGIPAYARYVRVLSNEQGSSSYRINFTGDAVDFAQYDTSFNDPSPIPIPPAATHIKIAPNVPQQTKVYLVFELVI